MIAHLGPFHIDGIRWDLYIPPLIDDRQENIRIYASMQHGLGGMQVCLDQSRYYPINVKNIVRELREATKQILASRQ